MTKELRIDLLAILDDHQDAISIFGCVATGVNGFHSDHYVIGDQCRHCGAAIDDQEIMDAYLAGYDSRDHYEARNRNAVVFFAVLATAEYHSFRWPVHA